MKLKKALKIEIEAEKETAKRWRDKYHNITAAIHGVMMTNKEYDCEQDYPENELKKIAKRITELEEGRR